MSDLDALRAEVEALRKREQADADHYEDSFSDHDDYAEMRYHTGKRHACELVLDLIDKHAREGQSDANH